MSTSLLHWLLILCQHLHVEFSQPECFGKIPTVGVTCQMQTSQVYDNTKHAIFCSTWPWLLWMGTQKKFCRWTPAVIDLLVAMLNLPQSVSKLTNCYVMIAAVRIAAKLELFNCVCQVAPIYTIV